MQSMRPYSAYLRVYEPLVAFQEPARAAWALYSDPEADLPDPGAVLERELQGIRRRLAATPPKPIPDGESDEALVVRIDGTTYICPLETRIRSVLAYASLDATLPAEVLAAALPPESRTAADAIAHGVRGSGLGEQVHVRQSRWHVPMPWFILFRAAERRLVLVPGHEEEEAVYEEGEERRRLEEVRSDDPGRTLSYLTRMSEARRRLAWALAVLRKTVEGTIIDEVETLGRWLEEFHPHAMVELDYGGLVHLVDNAFLVTDRSVTDVAEGIAALSDGDGEAAARHYQAVATRWLGVERYESVN
ncbi:MAG TPA: hypothetical protein VF053_13845 [Streptosporangiales bacterium]